MLPTAVQVIQDPEILLMAAQHSIVTGTGWAKGITTGRSCNYKPPPPNTEALLWTQEHAYGETF